MFTKQLIIFAVTVTLLATFISGQEVYDVSKQQCCDGNVYDKKRGSFCCGNGLYNKFETGCCGNQTVDFPSELSDEYSCCLNVEDGLYASYDYQTQTCCNGQVLDLPDLQTYYSCCGSELFRYDTHTCCGDQIVEDAYGTECCGTEMVTIDPESSQSCCGAEIIDTETQHCCTTYDYNYREQTNSMSYKVHDKNGDEECCGVELYDSDKQVCCYRSNSNSGENFVLDRPEGLADDEYPYCCGEEVIVSSASDNRACCHGSYPVQPVSYDMTTEQCCGGLVKPLDEDGNMESCCWNSGEFYDAETDVCTSAGIRSIAENAELGPKEDYCLPQINYY